MKERLKCIAINYFLEQKKQFDIELDEQIREKIRESENKCKYYYFE